VALYSQERPDHDVYFPVFKDFFYRFFKTFHARFLASMHEAFYPLFRTNDISEQRLASEYFTGLIQATKSWTVVETREVEDKIGETLEAILTYIGPYTLMNWLFAFHDITVSDVYLKIF
jgi:hypothetical protein